MTQASAPAPARDRKLQQGIGLPAWEASEASRGSASAAEPSGAKFGATALRPERKDTTSCTDIQGALSC